MTGFDSPQGDLLSVAARAYMEAPQPDEKEVKKKRGPPRRRRRPVRMLIIDTETMTENTLDNPKMPGFDPDEWRPHAQPLLFGSAHLYTRRRNSRKWKRKREWTFYSDDLPPPTLAKLRRCWNRDNKFFGEGHEPADAPDVRSWLMPLSKFLNTFYDEAVKPPCLIVGFNLPFDLSRIAARASPARNIRYLTGFSFVLWQWADQIGIVHNDLYRPRLWIRRIGEKSQTMRFSSVMIHGGNKDERKYFYPRGELLDVSQLCRALTGESLSLDGACEAMGLNVRKSKIKEHGVISQAYVRYNRQDVINTFDLTVAALDRFDRHPVSREHKPEPGSLSETRVYSGASIVKAYFRHMRIESRSKIQPDFHRWILAAAMESYYGGRTECRIWNTEVPVAPLDLTSCYPTVLALQKLWPMIIAKKVKIVECGDEMQTLLSTFAPEDLLDPSNWTRLNGFVKIIPDGDIVPVRARYSDGEPWKIAVNPYYSEKPQWYAIADLVTSRLLGGPIPRIVEAFQLVAGEPQSDLRPVKFGDVVDVDPDEENFFSRIVEERAKMKRGLPPYTNVDIEAGELALKIMANAGSYGVFVETNVEELPDEGENSSREMDLWASNKNEGSHLLTTTSPETPGPFSFPPLAAMITAGSRLLLALIQYEVQKRNGAYAFCDTDSLAVVSHPEGGTFSIHGSKKPIRFLTSTDVGEIIEKIDLLNPYDKTIVPHLLKREHSDHKVLYALSIGSKRYALYTIPASRDTVLASQDHLQRGSDEKIEVVEWKELALGAVIPTAGNDDGSDWTRTWWEGIVNRRSCPLPNGILVHRHSVQTAETWKLFKWLNFGISYQKQVKPFNFLILASRHPLDANQDRGPVVAPFNTDPGAWMTNPWIERSSGDQVSITTDLGGSSTDEQPPVCVRTIHDYYRQYVSVKPSKFTIPPGDLPGLLGYRKVRRGSLTLIGKESSPLIEATDAGLIDFEPSMLGEAEIDWVVPLRPILADLSPNARNRLSKKMDVTPQTLRRWIRGVSHPDERFRPLLEKTCTDFAADLLKVFDEFIPDHMLNLFAAHFEQVKFVREIIIESVPIILSYPKKNGYSLAERFKCDPRTLKRWGNETSYIPLNRILSIIKPTKTPLGLKRMKVKKDGSS